MQCPTCKQDMKKVGENHYHCKMCGACSCNGIRYQYFIRSEEAYCPQDKDWKKDPWIKTANLA
jgi:hypothetical protein